MNDQELTYLTRAIELAEEALDAGDEPFGSVLVSAQGDILAEDRNRIVSGDVTQHPEFTLARWAAQHMTPEARAKATVYTTGEHCAMCAAAHGWAGLGRIVYISSSEQLGRWLNDLGVAPPAVASFPIQHIVPGLEVAGPLAGWDEKVHALHQRRHAV
ncbi:MULTISPECIES: nucleoside deaminase [Halomonas]|uniref:Nucleoside deaminase n=1 Tax=Halomonas citrativorans TaxID=2742612 RepID=A0ABR9F7U0_9GAMM|nr:nucleoside deaminase [Halomonas citrativorans]MBE0402542.1 nucleoside deaminase [Halomonas citrativorans]